MFEEIAATVLVLVDRYGVSVLFIAFALEGAVIGKLIPTRALFVGLVIATGLTLQSAVSIAVVAVAGATVGQVLLFVAVRRLSFDPMENNHIPVSNAQVTRADGWLDRWGPVSVTITNALPIVRGTMTVPSALTRVSGRRFVTYSVVGTSFYTILLVAVAGGMGGLLPAELAFDVSVEMI